MPSEFSRNLLIRATDLLLPITLLPSDRYLILGWPEQNVKGKRMVQCGRRLHGPLSPVSDGPGLKCEQFQWLVHIFYFIFLKFLLECS